MTTSPHTSEEEIIGYLYRTLSDAERESLDNHFLECPDCRALLSNHEVQVRKIDQSLKATLQQASPSNKMTFAAIVPRLRRQKALPLSWLQMDMATPVFITVAGILFAVYGLLQGVAAFLADTGPQTPGAFPTLAGFFFIFVSVGQLEQALSIRPRFVVVVTLTVMLGLGTAILGLLNLLVIRDLAVWGLIALGTTKAQAGFFTTLAVLLSALIYIAGVIGGAEYHYRNLGQPVSWKLFAWTIGIELLIIVVPHFVY